MKVSPNGIAVLHHFESCALKAYPDPATGGDPWTIGWGHTGPGISKGLRWDQRTADLVFSQDLQRFEKGVLALVAAGINQGQFDALVSFAYNVGLGNLRTSSLLRMFNAGELDLAAAQFSRWNQAAGKVMKGLIRRRAAEAALFNGKSGAEAIAIGTAAA